MTTDEAGALLRDVLGKQAGLDPGAITLDMRVVDDLGLDSVDAVDVFTSIERRTGFEFEIEQLEGIETVGDVAERLVELSLESGDEGTDGRR